MASSYPGALDTMLAPAATLAGPDKHSDIEKRQNDAVVAVQNELGSDPAGAFATIAARLDDIESQLATIGAPVWQPFTPTFQGVTSMSSYAARYIQIGGLVVVMATCVVATTGSGQVNLTLPVATISDFSLREGGFGWFNLDSGPDVLRYSAMAKFWPNTTQVTARRVSDSGTSAQDWNPANNTPTTWSSGYQLTFAGYYEAA